VIVRWLASSLVLAAACTGTIDAPVSRCPVGHSQAIVNGAPEVDGGRAPWAIGGLEDEYGTLYCTGVVVGAQWVLTARHCAADDLLLGLTDAAGSEVLIPLGAAHFSDTADLALLEIPDARALAAAGVAPLALRPPQASPALNVADTLILAGVGITETGERGHLLFVEEPVAVIDAALITVDGQGKTGACSGDSGGPLLARKGEGFEVAGILSEGQASCMGLDRYTRVDANAAWIDEVTGRTRDEPGEPVEPEPCE
jgi:hypothetical protein